jgi:phage baseplate assembly protein W
VSGPWLDFPVGIDGTGRISMTDEDDHVRDLIQQVLFTAPGERVNRPDFGCGLLELVFEPNSSMLASAVQLRVRGSLQRWLGDLIEVLEVRVIAEDSRLEVDIEYVRLVDGARVTDRFVTPVPGAVVA